MARRAVRRWSLGCAVAAAVIGASTQTASAIPVLQIYLEGATYDSVTDTWVFDASSGDPIRLWTIGNIDGSGGSGAPILDVKLAAAYSSSSPGPVTITLTPTTTGGFGGFTDPSTPAAPTFIQTKTDGSSPLLSDGTSLPAHGIYGAGTDWQEFLLGDFSLTDSPVADFSGAVPVPAPIGTNEAQINVYDVVITGTDLVHFDLYNHIEGAPHAKAINAPFSHDGETTDGGGGGGGGGGAPGPIPEPITAAMGLMSLLGLGFVTRRRA